MSVELVQHDLVKRYGSVLPHVDRVPRTASEIYLRWTGRRKCRTKRQRHERRWLAKALNILAKEGEVCRGDLAEEGRTWIAFWREVQTGDESHNQNERETI